MLWKGLEEREGEIKQLGNLFWCMIFLTSHVYIWLFLICFVYCSKESIVFETLEKSLPLCKQRVKFFQI